MAPVPPPKIQRIAIVGAGPGGVAAAKYLQAEKCFEKIDIFEQQDSFGGVWNFCPADGISNVAVPQINPHAPLDNPIWPNDHLDPDSKHARLTFATPMYEGLETNIPHNLMRYSDVSFSPDDQLFPTRQSVLEYLSGHAKDVMDLVQFQTQVVDIRWEQDAGEEGWAVETMRLGSDKTSTYSYDAVVVANGHYNVPFLPHVKGIEKWNQAYPSAITHSKFYRNPAGFAGKKVIVVGNSASGADIANQIAAVAKHPVLNSIRSDSPLSFSAPWKKIVPEIAEFLGPSHGSRALRFQDGSVEADVDAVLFCTGYLYSFPFLSSLRPELIETGERVQHLYRHLFYIHHSSLAFIGLPSKIIPFRTFEGQAAVIARVWANRLPLPSQHEMTLWEEHELAERGSGKKFHVLPFPKDFDYHNDLVGWASMAGPSKYGRIPPKWSRKEKWQRERFPLIKKAFGERGGDRHSVRTVEELGFNYDQAPEEEKKR